MSSSLSTFTYDKIIEPSVIEAISESCSANTSQAVNDAWDKLPSFITYAAGKAGVTAEKLNTGITENMQDGVKSAVTSASKNLIRPIAVKLFGLIYSVILMLIFIIIVKFLAKIINKLFSFSIIGKVNRRLGGVVGAVKGVVLAIFFCTVISLIVSLTQKGFLIFTQENISNSHIFKLFTEIIPFNIF